MASSGRSGGSSMPYALAHPGGDAPIAGTLLVIKGLIAGALVEGDVAGEVQADAESYLGDAQGGGAPLEPAQHRGREPSAPVGGQDGEPADLDEGTPRSELESATADRLAFQVDDHAAALHDRLTHLLHALVEGAARDRKSVV